MSISPDKQVQAGVAASKTLRETSWRNCFPKGTLETLEEIFHIGNTRVGKFAPMLGLITSPELEILHSPFDAEITAARAFRKAFDGIRTIRREARTSWIGTAISKGTRGRIEQSIKELIYYCSWSSTCNRGQATMMHWITQALIKWAGCSSDRAWIEVKGKQPQCRMVARKEPPTAVRERDSVNLRYEIPLLKTSGGSSISPLASQM
jgi:hypothetical protein